MKGEDSISFEELFKKYQALSAENSKLKEENRALKARLGVPASRIADEEATGRVSEPESIGQQSADKNAASAICNSSYSAEKIRLFMSLFKGRDDVYAKRWESKKKGTSGNGASLRLFCT